MQPSRQSANHPARAWIGFTLRWGVLALLVGFVLHYLQTQWSQVEITLLPEDWLRLGLAQGVYLLGMGLLPVNSWLMQRWFGYTLKPAVVWYAFYVAQLAKYLPGGIWSIPGRALMYRRSGIPTVESGTLVLLEMLGMIIGASLIGLLSLPVFLPVVAPHITWVLPVGTGAVAAIVAAAVYLLRARLRPVWTALRRIRPAALLAVCAVYALNWVVIGIAFALLPAALHQPLSAGALVQVIGIHAVAWVVGFLAIFAPGGIGVRDGLLTLGLLAFLPAPYPVILSLIARIAWTIAEAVGWVIVALWLRWTGLPE